MNIAIDGPAGAGKSTIAKIVAKELGFIYVDTGAMYRAIAVYLLDNDISVEDENKVAEAIADLSVEIRYEDGVQQVYVNGDNITGRLRTEAVGIMASKASAMPCVREKLLSIQRELAQKNDVVMDGRDIGTHILPNAELKIYLTASVRVRARRRYEELVAKGDDKADRAKIEQDIILRDKQDMERKIAPLRKASDAILIDSSFDGIEKVSETIIGLAKERR